MAGNPRKNTARGQLRGQGSARWFDANVERQRARNKMAKASRRKNRRK